MPMRACLRRFKKSWKQYKSNPFEWIVDDFRKQKTFKLLVLKIGQAKIAGGIIENIINENPTTLDKVAIVLGEENLLVPLLFVAFLCWCFEYHNGLPSKKSCPNFDCQIIQDAY
jgi:hypothetical protein